ncbi:hypothetical protein, partial [Paraburkholderia gardini]|uniref:hypothetical protein n=1 Tax=Paraburkholderia gardini TaxID=2823469 RepID=UPI001E5BF99C
RLSRSQTAPLNDRFPVTNLGIRMANMGRLRLVAIHPCFADVSGFELAHFELSSQAIRDSQCQMSRWHERQDAALKAG